jgi:hypothetical protein
MFNYRKTDAANAITQNTFEQMNTYYTLVKISSGNRALLYKLKEGLRVQTMHFLLETLFIVAYLMK